MKNFDDYIIKYKEEFLGDLDTLLQIESVSADGCENPQKALNWMLDKARSFGLETEKVDNIAGHAEYGCGEKICGVLTHLDVVPAKRIDWSCPPFSLTKKDGRLYGRGVADNKGPALAALYCLRILKDSGISGNRVRVIFGTSEEIGMQDMAVYFGKMPVPDMSFTPDSEYGICKAEKGILHIEISSPISDNITLTQFESGTANNVVPDTAYALVDCSEYEEQLLQRLAYGREGDFELSYTIDGLKITSRGKAAHACEPEKGFNAAAALSGLLCAAFGYEYVGRLCSFVDFCIGMETNGLSMGIKMRDAVSGELTLTLSRMTIVENTAKAVLDIRYPVSINGDVVINQIKKVAVREGLDVRVIDQEEPLFLNENTEIIDLLKNAYKDVMNEEPKMYTTGGGTYARTLGGKGVAFGPVFEDDDSRIHNSDESLDEEKFFLHFRICMQAMYRMMTLL